MTRAAFIAAVLAAPAFAQDTWTHEDARAILRPTDRPGAVAEVVFYNELTHSMLSAYAPPLELNGLQVTAHITFRSYMDPDEMVLTVPEGFMAFPPAIKVAEGDSGVIWIFSTDGAGM